MLPRDDDFEFVPPPEAPVFEPDEDEWKDPLAYIAKIHPYAVKVGICKIRPPPQWQPTFSVDVDKFRFTPRIQKLNELEATTRAKLNFIDAIAKFWELQGSSVKLPNVEKKPLDVHQLHKIVKSEGGYEDVTRLRRWSRVALLMGFSSAQASAVLRRHYEKILYPYDVFMSGAMTGDGETAKFNHDKKIDLKDDATYIPDDTEFDDDEENFDKYAPPSYNAKASSRRSRYRADTIDGENENIDYSNPALKKLQFLAPGPKITGNKSTGRMKRQGGKYSQDDYITDAELKAIQGLTRRKHHYHPNNKGDGNIFDMVASWVDDYKCLVCDNGEDEDSMLLCDSCDSSYHMFCLIPPLSAIPPGDWRCPKCLAKECKKPLEAFGFEQAKKLYSLEDFSAMADKFKETYFSMPTHEVPPQTIEREFWRLVSSVEDDVAVEYGADLHTADHGSGFPMRTNTDDPDDEEYIVSPWNLNNMPNDDKSVLKHISQDISGMKVPWLYIGMCFSSFCWHTEDHWSYSINYLHWGEPKTWYGVPESEAEKLESCVKSVAPELFKDNPDLLHHLVTLCTPTTLMDYGVPIVRTNQQAGEFVVTFPRAYHAGFNQGYNCAEAVNFCPADWLSTGKLCVEHYRKLRRTTVFSHEELVCKMASMPENLDLDLAKKLYDNMKDLVENEICLRRSLHEKGILDKKREAFELIPDDERQCNFCKTTVFFSTIQCSCDTKRLACLHHADEICVCQNYKKFVKYRYTLDELPEMLNNLKKRADSFDNWEREVQKALSCSASERLELSAFKDLIIEAEESNFPECELLEQIKSAIAEAEQCSQVANQLLTKKHKTRKTATPTQVSPRLTLEELKDYASQVQNLPCIIKETAAIDKLMGQVESFRYEAKLLLTSDDYNEEKVRELLAHAETLDLDLPEINELRLDLKAAKWLQRIEEVLNQDEPISLDVIRGCVDQGIGLRKKQASERPLSRLKELLYAADRWEEKAKLCLQAKPRHMMGTLEVIVQEASKVKIILPNVSALKEALCKAKEWTVHVDKIQNDDYYPYYDILETLVTKGRPIPVRLEQLPQMESQVTAAKAWKERAARTFLKKGSSKKLIEILQPRKDVGVFDKYQRKKKYSNDKGIIKLKDEESTTKSKDISAHPIKKERTNSKDKKDKNKDVKSEKNTKENISDQKIKEEPNDEEMKQEITSPADPFDAPDPLDVAKELKEYEETEKKALLELRSQNKKKLYEENIEAPYCICRRPIEGFMIRCVLCLEWYHTSCIVVPKSISGKPIGKGFTSWSATREVRYQCNLCCRSRRPRLDTILSLLMSLQKLPVRVPEGEALQFLTERAMNWQDRGKQILTNTEVQRVLILLKQEVDIIIQEKPNLSATNLLVQKLITVQKFCEIKEETREEKIISNNTQLPQAATNKTETIKMDTDSSNKKLVKEDSELECQEKMTGSPPSKEETQASNPQVLLLQSENSSRAQSPIDVMTPVDASITIGLAKDKLETKPDLNTITMTPLPIELLDEIEMLACEGESLEVCLDEVSIFWAILQIQRPLIKEHCLIMNSDYRRRLVKERKKQRTTKRKIDTKPIVSPVIPPTAVHTKINATVAAKSMKKVKLEEMKQPKPALLEVKKEEIDDDEQSKDDDDNDDEDCSARPCCKPLGEEVEWVQCDKCENWYHVVCVGISAEEAGKLDVYMCPYCKPVIKKIKVEEIEEPITAVTKVNTEVKGASTEILNINSGIVDTLKMDMETNKSSVNSQEIRNLSPGIRDLSVIAEVAHKLVSGASENEMLSNITDKKDSDIPQGLNSLDFLADISDKVKATQQNTSLVTNSATIELLKKPENIQNIIINESMEIDESRKPGDNAAQFVSTTDDSITTQKTNSETVTVSTNNKSVTMPTNNDIEMTSIE